MPAKNSILPSVLFLAVLSAACLAAPLKPRIVVLTDISTWEPDDMESLIRLLVHADLFEIEGLVYTTGWSLETTRDDFLNLIHDGINAYEKDLPNLLKRSGQTEFLPDESRQEIGYWPSPDYLRSRTVTGSKNRGQRHIGPDNDSAGSKLIIQLADERDERPVWVQAWGGGNTLAQAIWRVQKEQSADALNTFLHRIRLYAITDQDRGYEKGTPFETSSHQWMRREFAKDLFFIWDECAWMFQNGTGKSRWDEYAAHIQGHGNLGRLYPKYKYGVEGDTPAFLYVLPNGLNDPEIPGHGSWGGYFEWAKGPDDATYAYTSQGPAYNRCRTLLSHFYPATFNNFAARMDWAKDGTGNRNPVVVVNGDKQLGILTLTPGAGTAVTVDASGTYDPDHDALTFHWWILPEAGSYTLNLPQTSFAMKANLVQREPQQRKRWDKDNIYTQIRRPGRARRCIPARRPAVCQRRYPHGPRHQQGAQGLRRQVQDDDGLRGPVCARLGLPRAAHRGQGDGRTGREGQDDEQAGVRRHCKKYASKYVKLQTVSSSRWASSATSRTPI
jgi:hypothetical protein